MKIGPLALVLCSCVDSIPAQPWSLTGLDLELDNLTRVAAVGQAQAEAGAEPVTISVLYEGRSAGAVDEVPASAVLDPEDHWAGGEFVITSEDVRYWPGSDGYSEVCASVYALASNISEPYDLGCIGAPDGSGSL